MHFCFDFSYSSDCETVSVRDLQTDQGSVQTAGILFLFYQSGVTCRKLVQTQKGVQVQTHDLHFHVFIIKLVYTVHLLLKVKI